MCADTDLRLVLSHILIDMRPIMSYIRNIVIYSRNWRGSAALGPGSSVVVEVE